MRIRAVVAYDGANYRGLQRQASGPTVQGTLEQAILQITKTPTALVVAGRTDAGVHAQGQVIAFDADWRHSLADLQRALNAVLPPDIAVCDLEQTTPDFHPRYAAKSRHYRYTVYNAPVRSPLTRHTSFHVAAPLDLAAMNRAATLLVGEYDFASFGQPTQGAVTTRSVFAAAWQADAPWLYFDIKANAFLFRMVRSIVGTLLQVGRGALTPEQFGVLLAKRDRGCVKYMAPAHGLCLVQVSY